MTTPNQSVQKRGPAAPPAPAKPRSPVAVAFDTVKGALERSAAELSKALGDYMRPEQFLRIVLTEVQRNTDLLECSPRSLVGAVFQAAQLGLTVDSTLGHAYLVPFKKTVTLIPGYKGLCQLAYRSQQVAAIGAIPVRKGEVFEWEEGSQPRIVHRPRLLTVVPEDETHEVIAVYARALMRGGGEQFMVMSRAQILARAKRSPAFTKKSSGPWVTDPLSMFKKTPTRDLCKWLPASTEPLQMAVALDEKADAGLTQGLESLAPRGVLDEVAESALDALAAALPEEPSIDVDREAGTPGREPGAEG